MKEITQISISGIGFTLTTQAYNELRSYLSKLEVCYKNNSDGAEVIADIEARIVELILSKQPLEGVVSEDLISDIVEQLGIPDELGQAEYVREKSDNMEGTFPRRFYREPEGARIGGVCSGLGAFLDIDPTWIRLSMFVPLLLLIILPSIGFHYLNGFMGSVFGAIVLTYFVMWIVVPIARTPRQRLEMRGKRITASSIEESISDEASAMLNYDEGSSSAIAKIFISLGRIVVFGLKVIIAVIGFGFAVAAIALLIGIIMLLTNSFSGGLMFLNIDGVLPVAYISMLLGVMLIPLVVIVYQIIRLVFKLRNNSVLMWILGGAWLILTVYVGVLTVKNYDVIRENIEQRMEYGDYERHYRFRYFYRDSVSEEIEVEALEGELYVRPNL